MTPTPLSYSTQSDWLKWLKWGAWGALILGLMGVLIFSLTVALIYPKLPSLDVATDYRPKIPLRIYTADGALIGEFGEEKRTYVKIADVPKHMKQAILAIEDDRFYEHSGIDFKGIARATINNLLGGSKQGASTITQQVAKNMFLTSEQTAKRKIYEALLSFKLEEQLTKDQILEIYINQIFLGQRAFGFASAARVYFGVPLKNVTIAQAAMLAGLPKAPTANNPVANFDRAKARQNYILERMRDRGYITVEQYTVARADPMDKIRQTADNTEVPADYVAEMVRKIIVDQYKDAAYTSGIQVYTTILKADQKAAYAAVRRGLMSYDRRHGYRGPEGFIQLPSDVTARDELIEETLQEYPDNDDLLSAVVIQASPKKISVMAAKGQILEITGEGLRLIAPYLGDKAVDGKKVSVGSVIRILFDGKQWQAVQTPEVEAAHIAINPNNGAVRALVGGFDYNKNKFNHVTQSWRQPGSSFKPFIYSAALEKGYSPDTIVEDQPFIIDAALTGGKAWEPKNYDGKFEGSMPLRTALAKSKNMVSIRLMQAVGGSAAQEWVTRFGFEASKHPPYLTMGLGAGSTNAWQLSQAYAVFANGGYKVNTFLINKVLDSSGKIIMQAQPKVAGDEDNLVIPKRNAYVMNTMLREVVRFGTAAKANVLKRNDIAGKTGTTNDAIDAWFAGYASDLVAITWVGFDQPKTLGDKETGGAAALPIWIDYMAVVLPGMPERVRERPPGLGSRGDTMAYEATPDVAPAVDANGVPIAAPAPSPAAAPVVPPAAGPSQ